MSTLSPAASSFLPAVLRRRIWGPMLVAFAVEALILAIAVLWLPPPSFPTPTTPGNGQAHAKTSSTRAHNSYNTQPYAVASRVTTIPGTLARHTAAGRAQP